MPKLPLLLGQEAVKIFCKIGYKVVRQRGSHIRLHHSSRKPLTVPDHKELSKGLLRTLIRDAGISIEDFCNLTSKKQKEPVAVALGSFWAVGAQY